MSRFLTLLFAFFVVPCTFACGEKPDVQPPPTTPASPDGAACAAASLCAGNTCLTPLFGYPGGYCTTSGCETDDDCSADEGRCLQFLDDSSLCLLGCQDDADCRAEYACSETRAGSVCLPANIDPEEFDLPSDVTFSESKSALGFDCSPEELDRTESRTSWRFSFEVSPETKSFMIVPSVESGTVIPKRLRGPSTELDFEDYRHHNTGYERLTEVSAVPFGTYGAVAFDWPILVPFAPRFADVVESGSHQLDVITDEAQPCLYVVEGGAGTTIDLDIYLVGVPGLSAAAASDDPDLTEMLAAAESHFAPAGIEFGEVVYRDATAEVAERFSIVRNLDDIDLLTATGAPRSGTLGGHLHVDIFIVETILFDAISVLGVSAGVPGPAGLHGNGQNGLVFGAADLGSDNALVGQVFAHELSHYLGLRHTTELSHGRGDELEASTEAAFGTTDPIEDSPECDSVIRLGSACPDYDNLMFPLLQNPNDAIETRLTPGQDFVLQRSPLVR